MVTAAPGPQQPDEVRPHIGAELYSILRAAAIDLGMVHGRPDLGRELRTLIDWHETRPAAPSAQPDEFACGDCGHRHGEDRACRSQRLGADQVCNCPRWVAAQPVRDTEGGRR